MAVEFIHSAQTFTEKAGADLSSSQYRFVKLDANGDVVPIAADTDVPFGLLLNAPKSGFEAHIAKTGRLKVEASAAVVVGAFIGVSANGRAVTRVIGTDTTKYVTGRAVTAASAAGVIFTVEIDTLVPRLA